MAQATDPAASASATVARPPEAPAGGLILPASAARQLDVCVHCGFCLPACPTYRELGEEADSPRGRIDMIGGAFRGEISVSDPDFSLHLDRCLDCRACESACPSGVRYHELFEGAMAQLPARRPWTSPSPERAPEAAAFTSAMALLRIGMRRLVRRPRILALLVRLAQRLPLVTKRLPPGVTKLLLGLPQPAQVPARQRLPMLIPAQGPHRGEVDLFLGCVQDAVLGDDNVAIARTLSACGFAVHVLRAQTCCGALHVHIGDRAEVLRLARDNLAAFAGSERPIILGAAGCSAVLRDYGHLLADTPWAEAGAALAARVRDLAEFLAEVSDLPMAMPPGGAPVKVTWHDPCHLCHAQGIRNQPRDLIRAIPGLEYVELPEADACCGSAGVYNLTQPELSSQVLARKVANIAATGARWVVTANPGCALQLRAGLREAGLDVAVLSLGQLLLEAYGGKSQ